LDGHGEGAKPREVSSLGIRPGPIPDAQRPERLIERRLGAAESAHPEVRIRDVVIRSRDLGMTRAQGCPPNVQHLLVSLQGSVILAPDVVDASDVALEAGELGMSLAMERGDDLLCLPEALQRLVILPLLEVDSADVVVTGGDLVMPLAIRPPADF